MMVDKRTAELTGEEIVVWGYHGTTQERADAILAHGQFRLSQNPWEWLGDGVYFWQDAPSRALQWGSEWAARTGEKVAVLRARIRLGEGCLDLLDTDAAELIWEYARHFGAKFPKGRPWPMNRSSGRHELDATFFNWVALALAGDGIAVTSIRAAIAEGEPLFEGSPIRRRSHVQIAVREPKFRPPDLCESPALTNPLHY